MDIDALPLGQQQRVPSDYCPDCRGVWLDRGELDKLLRRDDEWNDHDRGWDRDREYSPSGYPKKKRWLSEVFDFD